MADNRMQREQGRMKQQCAALSRPRRRAIARLRSAYFAHAGESAARYGVTFARVIEHLWHASRCNQRFLLRSVTYFDDLVHAIACIDNSALAWSDLAERYERALIRRCRGGQDDIKSTIIVRRLFAELRRHNLQPVDSRMPSLHPYTGSRPLRSWLADRLQVIQAQELIAAGDIHVRQPIVMRSVSGASGRAFGGGAFAQGPWRPNTHGPLLRLASCPSCIAPAKHES